MLGSIAKSNFPTGRDGLIAVETVPWRFTAKDGLPRPNAGRVPVIADGDRVVHDSSGDRRLS